MSCSLLLGTIKANSKKQKKKTKKPKADRPQVQEGSNPAADRVAEAQDLEQADSMRAIDVVKEALNVKKNEGTGLAGSDCALGIVGEAKDSINRTVVVATTELVRADHPETVRLI
jgi:hypothetical protein